MQEHEKENIGSTFDSFLREEGLYEAVSATAIKRVVARQVEHAMHQKGLTKAEMARRMHTSRALSTGSLTRKMQPLRLLPCKKPPPSSAVKFRLELV